MNKWKKVDKKFVEKELDRVLKKVESEDYQPINRKFIPQFKFNTTDSFYEFDEFNNLFNFSFVALLHTFKNLTTLMYYINFPLKYINWNYLAAINCKLNFMEKYFSNIFTKDVAKEIAWNLKETLQEHLPKVMHFYDYKTCYSVFSAICDFAGCDVTENIIDVATMNILEIEDKLLFKNPTVYLIKNLEKANKTLLSLFAYHADPATSLEKPTGHFFIFQSDKEPMINVLKDKNTPADIIVKLMYPKDTYEIPFEALKTEKVVHNGFITLAISWYESISDYIYSLLNVKDIALIIGAIAAAYSLYYMYTIYYSKRK